MDLGSLHRLTPISSKWGLNSGRPIDRYYIEDFLACHADAIRGRVLEIDDSLSYARKFGGERVTEVDALKGQEGLPQQAIIADLASYNRVPAETYDCVIMAESLQLIYDMHRRSGSFTAF